MSEAPNAITVDALTGQVTERLLTDEEIADLEQLQEQGLAQQAEEQAKADARESALAKLAALGLTQDEINAL
jgi:hypothetical protein